MPLKTGYSKGTRCHPNVVSCQLPIVSLEVVVIAGSDSSQQFGRFGLQPSLALLVQEFRDGADHVHDRQSTQGLWRRR